MHKICPVIGRAIFRRVFDDGLRGFALFLGCFVLISLFLSRLGPIAYDANIWWIDLRALPDLLQNVLLLVFVFALLHRAIFSAVSERVYRLRAVALGLLVVVLLTNSVSTWLIYLSHVAKQSDRPAGVGLGVPVPLTAVLAMIVLCMLIVRDTNREDSRPRRARRAIGMLGFASLFAIMGALSQMVFFGESDYRRPADAIVVYGCKAYANGNPSQALADRVHTACELYHQGLAPVIVMSGGPVDAGLHETQVMADYAVSLGVPREAIVLDRFGHDTSATADNLSTALQATVQDHPLRVLAVSHDYHLPRVKLSLERQGITAYTVPCEVRRGLPGKPYFVARETAAWWYYYFAPALAFL